MRVKTKAVTGWLAKGVRWARNMSEEASTVVVVQEEKSQGRRRRGRGRRMPRRRGRQGRQNGMQGGGRGCSLKAFNPYFVTTQHWPIGTRIE